MVLRVLAQPETLQFPEQQDMIDTGNKGTG
jgi:hypothetical protein